jgi:hypothetical protein
MSNTVFNLGLGAAFVLVLLTIGTGCSSQPSQEETSKKQGEVIQQHFQQKVDRTKRN